MLGTKYLSELVDLKRLYVNTLNVIYAPTGSGKSYFALNTLSEHCPDAYHHVLYLIDTINGREQILRNYNSCPASKFWIDGINEGTVWFTDDRSIVVMTYALFGSIFKDHPDFSHKFTYIVCDELHKGSEFQYFDKRLNTHTFAITGIKSAIADETTTVIALSATPQRIYKEFKNYEINTLDIDRTILKHYETKKTIKYSNLKYLLTTLSTHKTGICYISHITNMKEVQKTAAALGLKSIAIWSTHSKDHQMNEEQLRVRDIILNEYRIPSEYNFLIINSSSETSIKIKSKVDYVIVHNANDDIQTQVRGRVDNDLDVLYLHDDVIQVDQVPTEYLDKELYKADKDRLCIDLNIIKDGHVLKWTRVKKLLIESGIYNIEEKRKNNLRYAIIKKNKKT